LKDVQIMKFLLAAMIVLNLGGLAMAAEKAKTPGKEDKQGTVHTVTASMDYPTTGGIGIQAEKRPGEFTIAKGSKGTKLKYQFFNPKSGNTLTKLNGSNIYSVTEKRYMHELDHNPDFELPPGQYRFVVGGDPGAIGTLSYTTVSSKGIEPPTRKTGYGTQTVGTSNPETERAPIHPGGEGKGKMTVPRNGKLSLILWVPEYPAWKLHLECEINNGAVVGRGETPDHRPTHIANFHEDYSFKGTAVGERIIGTASQKDTWESKDGSTKHNYDGKGEMELTLRADHTITGSELHSGTTNGEPSITNQKRVLLGTWRVSQESATKP
jgi:hypothetical protein